MARKHIEFVDTATLPWQPVSLPGIGGDAREKILSEDDESGAVTLMLELPRAWHQPARGYRHAPTEIFILRGDLATDEVTLTEGCYSYIPPGMAHGPFKTDEGCTALVMLDDRPDFMVSDTSAPDARLDSYIACIDSTKMNWSPANVEGPPPGIVIKLLRIDPTTNDWSWVAAVVPLWQESRAEVHPTVEEAFMLRGDTLLGERGVMHEGCYFWRPPNVPHGPMLSKTGGMWFFRTKGGGMNVTYTHPPQWERMVKDYLASGPLFALSSTEK